MAKISIDSYRKMKMEDLIEAKSDIEIVIQEKKLEAEHAFKQEMTERAKSLGLDISSMFGGKRRGAKAGSVKAMYRDPHNPSNEWSGRGRPAKWLSDALKADRKLKKEDFLIEKK